jgi:hypothetical protein
MAKLYHANVGAVCHETFDAETVLINFEAGTYFSLNQSAPVIWAILQQPVSMDGLLSRLAAEYSSLPANARTVVSEMVELLHTEGCLVTLDGDDALVRASQSPTPGHLAFEPPIVQVFNDLKDLIVIDPVHEVAPLAGWPHQPPPAGLD